MKKILFKCLTGSKLYGTNTPDSDDDFIGVFANEEDDYFGLQNPADEMTDNIKLSDGDRNTKGDTDCKYVSIRQFLKLAAQGQSAQLEMLFAPPEAVIVTSPIWEEIKANKHLLLCKKGVAPIVGFCLAQAHKAVIKCENLRTINALIQVLNIVDKNSVLSSHFVNPDLSKEEVTLFGNKIRYFRNDHGFINIEIAGRMTDVNIKVKVFLDNLKKLQGKYGTRVQDASEDKYDYKSIMHAMRLLYQAEEFLLTGNITLPRPEPERSFLMSIRNKQWPTEDIDVFQYIKERIDNLMNETDKLSSLPKEVDWGKINNFCIKLTKKSFKE